MTPKGKMKSYTGCVWSLVLFIALAVMVLMFGSVLSGCKHVEYVTVPEYHTDTLIQTNVQKDSIYLHDSIHVKEKNDTVFYEHWHTNYKEKLVHDTIYKSRVDSVAKPYPVEVVKWKEKELNWWQKLVMGMGSVLLVLIGGFIAVWLYKLFVKFKPL